MKNESNWRWWIGHSEERYHTECETLGEALKIIERDYKDGAWITEAIKETDLRLSTYFDADTFVENSECSAHEDWGDEYGDTLIFDMSGEDMESLARTVKAAIEAWQKYRNIKFEGYRFSRKRNTEFVSAGKQHNG